MAAFNAERSIERGTESVHDQSYQHFVLIIANDESTDGTGGMVRRFAAENPRIRHLEQPNAGPSTARNLATARAKGVFVASLDSNDTWPSAALERQVAGMLEAGPHVEFPTPAEAFLTHLRCRTRSVNPAASERHH